MDPREWFGRADTTEVNRLASDRYQRDMWTAIPGIVQSFDAAKLTVTVQPTIQGEVTKADRTTSFVNLPVLPDVPVYFPNGGGYSMTYPIVAGDECLVVFASRCIDNWWQRGGVQQPFDRRIHDLSDGFAFVGPFSQPRVIPNVSTTNAQFRSNDGTLLVELDKTGGVVHIKAPTQVLIDAPLTRFTGIIDVVNANHAGVSATIAGTLTATVDLKAQAVSLHDHIHSGVQSGSGTTGRPVG